MIVESGFEYFFFAVFAVVIGSFLFKMIKYRGFKGAMFGAQIHRAIGEVPGSGTGLMNVSVRVHTLGSSDVEPDVGLEFVAKSFASYQMMPIKLSAADAKWLASLLESAAGGLNGT